MTLILTPGMKRMMSVNMWIVDFSFTTEESEFTFLSFTWQRAEDRVQPNRQFKEGEKGITLEKKGISKKEFSLVQRLGKRQERLVDG